MAGNKSKIDIEIQLCSGAGRIDGAQYIQNRSASFSFSKFGTIQHTLFNSQSPLSTVICIFKLWSIQIEGQFFKIIDDIVGGLIKISVWRPLVRSNPLRQGSRGWGYSGDSCGTAIFYRKPNQTSIALPIFKNIFSGCSVSEFESSTYKSLSGRKTA